MQAKFLSTYGPKRLIKQCILITDCHRRLLLVTPLIKSFFKRFQTIPISKPLDVSVFLILMLHKETSFLKIKSLECIFVGYSEEHKHKGRFWSVWWKSIFLFYSGFGSNFGGESWAAAAESHSWISAVAAVHVLHTSAPTTYNIGGSTAVLHVSAAAAWSDVTAAFIFGFSAAHAQAWPVHVTAHSQTDSLYEKQVNAGIQSIVWSSWVSGPIISFSKSQKIHTPIDRFISYGSYSLDLSTSLSEI